jgi:sugar/nucleoside kinase (ribokinase family)
MFDLVTVGHFAIDLILSPKISTPKPTLGGAPTYVSLAARKLGSKVSVISKVGEDFPDEYVALLNANAVDLTGFIKVEGASTTRFIISHKDWKRKLQLKSLAPPILMRDIPSSLRSKAIHVAPIVKEISSKVIERLRTHASTLSLDPQGFVRRFDRKGNMSLSRWQNSAVLRQIDVYKSSLNEIKVATGFDDLHSGMKKIHEYGAKIVIVTRGIEGSTLFFEDRFYDIPACRPKVVKDPTGAGDSFIGAFLAEYTKAKDPVWCACVGSAASSFVIEGVGPAVFGEKEETYQRATDVYDEVAVEKR